MIAFTCPNCKTFYTKWDQEGGQKFNCSCGQRIQIPPAPTEQSKTVLGVAAPTAPLQGRADIELVTVRAPMQTSVRKRSLATDSLVVFCLSPSQWGQNGAAHSLGITSLVVGLFALAFALIPCLGIVVLPLIAIGLLLGLGGFFAAVFRDGRGIGFSIGGVVANGTALAVAILWLGLLGGVRDVVNELAKEEDPTSDKRDKKPVRPKDDWVDASKFSVDCGVLQISLTSASVGHVELVELGRAATSKDKLLVVRLLLKNLSETKKVEYSGWGDRDFILRGRRDLKDNFGNLHHSSRWGFGTAVKGQVRIASIFPKESLEDVLVFDRPVEKAEFLRLELPASAFGTAGKIRFEIPKTMFNP